MFRKLLTVLCAPALCLALAAPGAPAAEVEIEEGVKPLPPEGAAAAEPGPAKAEPKREYGYLGVGLKTVPAEVAKHLGLDSDGRGLVIDEVQEGSPAAAAGLLSGDIVVGVDDQVIYSLEQLQKLIAARKPGTEVTVQWIRKGREGSTSVKLGSTTQPAWRQKPADGLQILRWPEVRFGPGEQQGDRPPAILRWRVPGSDEWKSINPDVENWREQVEKLLEGLRSDLPEDVMQKLREQMDRTKIIIEKRRKQAQDAAERARGEAAGELKLNPAEVLEVPDPEDLEISTSTTVTAQQGGYRVNFTRKAGEPARVSLYGPGGGVIFEDLPEKELDARLEGLEPTARKLLEMARKTAGDASVRVEPGK
jgi:hypothetical protein